MKCGSFDDEGCHTSWSGAVLCTGLDTTSAVPVTIILSVVVQVVAVVYTSSWRLADVVKVSGPVCCLLQVGVGQVPSVLVEDLLAYDCSCARCGRV